MVSRIAYHVHNRTGGTQTEWTTEEKTHFLDHIQRLQPTTLLFKDNRELALEAQGLLPDCRVILRKSYRQDGINESNMWALKDIDWHIDTFAPDAEGGLALNIWHKPKVDDRHITLFAAHYAKLMDAFGKRGIPIVGPNLDVGLPDEYWLVGLEPMWEAFDRWANLHDYGVHEYGTYRGMMFHEVDNPFNVFPYRVGRNTDLCTVPYLMLQQHVIPTMVFTEWGITAAFDNTNYQGWRSCRDEEEYAIELIHAERELGTDRPFIRGFCIASYGNSGHLHRADDCSSYDVMDAHRFQSYLEANTSLKLKIEPIFPYDLQASSPSETEIDAAIAEDSIPATISLSLPAIGSDKNFSSDWQMGIAQVNGGAFINIRNRPTLDAESIAQLYPGTQVWYRANKIDNWWHIKLQDGQEGYASANYLEFISPQHTYNYPLVLSVSSIKESSAQWLVDHLMSKLVDSYLVLSDDDGSMSDIVDFNVIQENPETLSTNKR